MRNPSYLSVLNDILYAGSEYEDGADLAAYRINGSLLRLTVEKKLEGKLFCHLYSVKAAGTVFATCLLSANLFILDPHELDVLSELSMFAKAGEKPLAHCSICSKDGKILAVTDMGRDRVYVCSLVNGVIDESARPYVYQSGPGCGPRHLVFHSALNMLYVANENSCTVDVFSINRNNNSITLEQQLSAGGPKEGVINYLSSIIITNDDRYIMVANRGLDTIFIFPVSDGGLLERAREYPCYGKWPRHIVLTNDMRYLVLSNQHSDNVIFCPFNLSDGSIDKPVCKASVPAPSCVVEP